MVNMTAGKKLVRRRYPGFLDRHSRLEQPFHALAHRRRICISIEPRSLQGEIASVQVPRIRQYNGCFEQTVAAFFAEILYELAQREDQRFILTLVRMLAPSENPIPNRGRLGKVFLNHLTVSLTSHVARALYKTLVVTCVIAQPLEITTHASHPPSPSKGARTCRR